jgi:hypothetical protein
MEQKGLHNMVMQISKSTIPKTKTTTKRMDKLDRGEVCFMENVGYIMRIGLGKESLFLILSDDDGCDHYDMIAAGYHYVRELYADESITINFS